MAPRRATTNRSDPMKIGQKIRRRREELRLSQADLGEQVGVSQATIDKIEAGHTARSRYLALIAVKLGLPLEEIDPGLAALSAAGALKAPVIPGIELMGGDRDFPIHASAEGGQGQIIVSTDAVDFMPRPAPLAHVKGAYGLYITGESMVPEFEPGDVALVNPHLPLVNDVTCIFYGERDGATRATIKRLVRQTPEVWHVKQWNPPEGMKAQFTLAKSDWQLCHRTLGKYSRR
jgi:phage repressor protein C with HTH and peptisase S24 domain